jgi:type VI secretion system Hcp family effector
MPFDAFLKIDAPSGVTIPGETTDGSKSTTEFAVTSFSWGLSNATSIGSASGGAGAGKAKFSEFKITKPVDKSSPLLFKMAAMGTHAPSATLTLIRNGYKLPFLTVKLNLVFVTDIETNGISQGQDDPEETITLVFGALSESFAPTLPKGGLGSPVTGQWDQVTNSQNGDGSPA